MGNRWLPSTPAWIPGSCSKFRRSDARGMSPGNSRGPGGGKQAAGLLCARDPGRWTQRTRRGDPRARSLRGQVLDFGEMKNVESRKAGSVMGGIWKSGTREGRCAGWAEKGSRGPFGVNEWGMARAGRGTRSARRGDPRARSARWAEMYSGELGNGESRKAGRVVRGIWKSGTREGDGGCSWRGGFAR